MKKINEDFTPKPTIKKPVSDISKGYEKTFDRSMKAFAPNVNLTETDDLLTEKEQSLKKKIFSLAKMESLVFSDPKLSAVYDDMAENGEEKYGYHYNETIMNMIFNDYVLNSPKYLQKYKMAIPKKKKRRDKSGINQLKKSGEIEISKKEKNTNETTGSASSGAFVSPVGVNKDNNIVDETTDSSSSGAYSTPSAWGKGDLTKGKKNPITSKPIWSGGAIIQESNYLIDPSGFHKYIQALNEEGNQLNRNEVNDFIVDKSSAFNSDDVKNWKNDDAKLQLDTINSGVIDKPNLNEFLSLHDVVEYDSEMSGEKPFNLGGDKWQFVWGKYPSGKKDIAVYKFGADLAYDYSRWKEEYSMNIDEETDFMKIKNDIGNPPEGADFREDNNKKAIFYYGDNSNAKSWAMNASQKYNIPAYDTKEIGNKAVNEDNHDDLIELDVPEWALSALINDDYDGLSDEDIEKLNKFTDDMVSNYGNAHFMLDDIENKDNLGFKHYNDIDDLGSNVYRLYLRPSKTVSETDQSIISDTTSGTMALKPQSTGTVSNGSVPTGMSDVNESFELLNKMNNELEIYSNYHINLIKMTEDRKPSALVLKDRLGAENKTNFKRDLQHSGTKEIINVEKELMYKDQQVDVGNNPQKLSTDIEKELITGEKGTAFKNVGDSTNKKGNEIPKRNLTDAERNEVDNYRLGVGDYEYDNKPSDRFEERMKTDMGDDLYKLRQEKLKQKNNAPMYNKDVQPITNEKDVNENMVTGRYFDALNKSRIIDFRLDEVKGILNKTAGLFEIDFTGLGNSYKSKSVDNKIFVNENVVNALNKNKYYTDGTNVFSIKNKSTKLNESENKISVNSNENINKMKHLLGYKPNDFVNTNNIKKNRGF